MFLKELSLINYKSFSSADFMLDEKINCFVGNNGVGKTNVLDAVYHLAFAKSYFNPPTVQNIKHNEDFFVINGEFDKDNKSEKITVSAKRGQSRVMKRNGKIYDRISDHIGLIPLVIISPADRDLIIEGSETRRKFLDSVISLSNKSYLSQLITYNKLVQQRNALLKYFYVNRTFDATTLSVYNEQLQIPGDAIYATRKDFIARFEPIFIKYYQQISQTSEIVSLHYDSTLHDSSMAAALENALAKDKIVQYTSAGIHKDDLGFDLNGHNIKKYGSQGQQKSFLIALKLAQFEFLKLERHTTPILLLDDIFDKLDEHRVAQIVSMVNDSRFGQLFISDTHPERTEQIIKTMHQTYKIFNL